MLIPWPCVTALRLQPIGPVDPRVFGLAWVEENTYHLCEPRKVIQMREALGTLVYDQRMAKLNPWYIALCEIHRSLQEPVYRGVTE